jgi:uncharacterized protein YggE
LTRRIVFAATVATAALVPLPAVATAAPAPEGRTIAVYATGRARVVKPAEQTNTAIRRAVAAAHDKALPTAIANARGQAQKLAAASGLTLGEIISIEEQQLGVPFAPYGVGFESGKSAYAVRRTWPSTRTSGDRAGSPVHVVREPEEEAVPPLVHALLHRVNEPHRTVVRGDCREHRGRSPIRRR